MEILYTNEEGTFFNKQLLQHIKEGNNNESWPILLEKNVCNLIDSLGRTLLHFAAGYGNKELAKHLINLGMKVDIQDQAQETPLMVAVEYNQEEVVKILLEANADIYLLDAKGQCALGKSFKNVEEVNRDVGFRHLTKEEKVLKEVVKNIQTALMNKVTVESLNNSDHVSNAKFHNDCPLFHFIQLKNSNITRTLLEKGSPIDASESHSRRENALNKAIMNLDLDNIKVLVEYGAELKGKNGNTGPLSAVLYIKGDIEYDKVLELLKLAIEKEYDYDCCESLVHKILMYADREIVHAALPIIMDLYSKKPPVGKHLQPLFYVSMNPTPNILEELQDFYFEVNGKCSYGKTMMHSAAQVGNVSSVKYLLNRGADIQVLDQDNYTPMIRTVNFAFCCHWPLDDERILSILECIEIFLDRDADPQVFKEDTVLSQMKNFQAKISEKVLRLFEPIIVRVAWREVSGLIVEEFTLSEIKSVSKFENIFSLNKLHLEEIKDTYIGKGVTLLDFFAEKEKMVSHYALNKRLAFNVNHELKSCDKSSYCHRKLLERLSKLNELVKLREKISNELNVILTEICGMSVYNVAENIVNYVSDVDLYKMM